MTKEIKIEPLEYKDPLEQLMALKEASNLLGTLHYAQAYQLKCWAAICIPHSKNTKYECNFGTKTVVFKTSISNKSKKPKNLNDLLKNLETWVKVLLGDDWKVTVKNNKEVIFNSNATQETGNKTARSKRTRT